MIGERGIAAATSLSILLEVSGYHTGGVTLRKPLSFPLQFTYLEVVGSNPVTNKKISAHKSRVEVAACSKPGRFLVSGHPPGLTNGPERTGPVRLTDRYRAKTNGPVKGTERSEP